MILRFIDEFVLNVPRTVIGLQFALSTGFTWLFTMMFGVLCVSSQLKVFAVKDALDEPEVSDGDCRYMTKISTYSC
jgi:hypothetical protein